MTEALPRGYEGTRVQQQGSDADHSHPSSEDLCVHCHPTPSWPSAYLVKTHDKFTFYNSVLFFSLRAALLTV
jgi:hypothetical protein